MRAYILTLMEVPARRDHATYLQSELEDQGFTVILSPGVSVDSRNFRDIPWVASADLPKPITAGEMACTYGHAQILRKIVKSDLPAFVLEDDAMLHSRLSEVQVSDIPEFLSLSCWNPDAPFNQSFTYVEKRARFAETRGLPYGTQCYYVTPVGAQKALEQLLPVRWTADLAYDAMSREGHLTTHLANSPIAVQHPNIQSQIGQR